MGKKVAVITGASRGIGKAIAYKLAEEGYDLILNCAKNENMLKDLAIALEKQYNIKTSVFCADLSSEENCVKFALFAINQFDKIDVLVNNAGVCFDCELMDRTFGKFVNTFKVNTFAPFLLSKIIGEFMFERKFGKIINISSNNSINQFYPTTIDYDASKSALNSLTKNFAISFSPYVNVNAIAPGWIETDMNVLLTKEYMESEKEKILKHRIGTPDDVANLVSFLVDDKADYINGQVIAVDGGMF